MPSLKKYHVTFRRIEEIVVELHAQSEAEAKVMAFDDVLGDSPIATVRAVPRISVPQAVAHNATEWIIEKVVQIVTC
ncbi:MAG: hypothetical protein WDN29_03205 [Methylovirgula sp.]